MAKSDAGFGSFPSRAFLESERSYMESVAKVAEQDREIIAWCHAQGFAAQSMVRQFDRFSALLREARGALKAANYPRYMRLFSRARASGCALGDQLESMCRRYGRDFWAETRRLGRLPSC